jgi:hypothetical protein
VHHAMMTTDPFTMNHWYSYTRCRQHVSGNKTFLHRHLSHLVKFILLYSSAPECRWKW